MYNSVSYCMGEVADTSASAATTPGLAAVKSPPERRFGSLSHRRLRPDGRFGADVSYGHYILGSVRRMIVWERGERERKTFTSVIQ